MNPNHELAQKIHKALLEHGADDDASVSVIEAVLNSNGVIRATKFAAVEFVPYEPDIWKTFGTHDAAVSAAEEIRRGDKLAFVKVVAVLNDYTDDALSALREIQKKYRKEN